MAAPTLALIVAAGRGERLKSDVPKAYVDFAGMPLLRHSLLAFSRHPLISGIKIVIAKGDEALFEAASAGISALTFCYGGVSRQESVRLGLEAMASESPAHVLIHDAARPHASEALITRVCEALEKHEAAIPATALRDTVKQVEGEYITATLPRESLVLAQTPQGFRFAPLLAAHRIFADHSVTDDAAIAELAGMKVHIVAGDEHNRKLTTPDDMTQMMTMQPPAGFETRTGMGVDVHPFRDHDADTPPEQRHIALCGLHVPCDKAVVGHSDADCALHALVDALLGTIGAGDIGMHFPPEDPRWAGADSSRFLLHAYSLLREKGGEIVNIDLTILCERPKISPLRAQMQQHIAKLLKLEVSRVNIKATTTEKLGFLGRGEGIAAQAVATVRLPV